MKKFSDFDILRGPKWPEPKQIEHYFFARPGEEWFQDHENDGAILMAQGVYGTEDQPLGQGRVDIDLQIWGKPGLGVLLIYSKWGGGYEDTFSSKGDLRRLSEWVRSTHGDPLPVGLFIPFIKAYDAVKEFIETDGQLPKCIEWVANQDLPPGTFPDP
jgi:immunity protein Imm1 of predicted polymorphic toxin system